jgi:F-type H+-transporting ATPase subunit b
LNLRQKITTRRAVLLLICTLLLAVPAHRVAGAENFLMQEQAAPASAANNDTLPPAQADPEDERDQYRISYATRWIGRELNVSPKVAAAILELVNFAILFSALGWLLKKKLPLFLRSRSERLKKQLVDARAATEDANHRLHAIEERLAKLDGEIIAMRQSSEREVNHEEERFRKQLEAEKDRIVTMAEQEIDNASHSARRDLKRFAADLAVDTAEQRIRMTPELDQRMIDEFLETLGDKR